MLSQRQGNSMFLFWLGEGRSSYFFFLLLLVVVVVLTSNNIVVVVDAYSFHNIRLQGAVEMYHEAQDLVQNGNYKDACDTYMTAIFMGRSTVQKLQEEKQQEQQGIIIKHDDTTTTTTTKKKEEDDDDHDHDDPDSALSWLVSSYIECCYSQIVLNDWMTARADAWAACSYSQNQNKLALIYMWYICQNTNDLLGEYQTLQLLLPVCQQEQQEQEQQKRNENNNDNVQDENDENNSNGVPVVQQQSVVVGGEDLIPLLKLSLSSFEDIEQRLQVVQIKLEEKFKKNRPTTTKL